MFYRQGRLMPGHPGNTGRKPLLIGLGDQVRAQAEYLFRGNYGLGSEEEIAACGVPADEAREMMAVKKWFSFGRIKDTTELVDTRALDADAVGLAPGVVVHRKGFNRYESPRRAGSRGKPDSGPGGGIRASRMRCRGDPFHAIGSQSSILAKGRLGREASLHGKYALRGRPALPRGRRANISSHSRHSGSIRGGAGDLSHSRAR